MNFPMTKKTIALSLVFLFVLQLTASAQFLKRRAVYKKSPGAPKMSIEKSEFGKTADGRTVDKYTLDNGRGITAEILNLGGVIWAFNVPDKDGNTVNVSANLETVAEYEKIRPFFGALVGRYGNRIAKAAFKLDGKEYKLAANNGPNALHGGKKGFDTVLWNVEEIKGRDYIGLKLTYTSKDGEEGYPGTMDVTVLYKLDTKNQWTMDYTATTDKKTVLNLTNHTFWNLAGYSKDKAPTNHEHLLTLNADRFLPTDGTLIPTGELKAVEGTPLDFRTPHKIGERIADVKEKQFNGGYDHCFILNQRKKDELTLCAKVVEPESGRTMTIWTTEPGVQFYSGNFLDGKTQAFGVKYVKHASLCLETQHYPNSPNMPAFPSTVLEPGETFRSTTIHQFGIEK